MKATIYHNPSCSKSCHALDRLTEAGAELTVIEYLNETPTREELREVISAAGLSVREAVRTTEPQYRELGLAEADDEALLDALVAHPGLIQRPLVVTDRGTGMARTDEALERLL